MSSKLKYFLIAILVLLGLRFIFSTENPENVIEFPNEVEFHLNEGSRVIKPTSKEVERFQMIVGNDELSIPLFRCVFEKEQKTYFSLPIGTSFQELSTALSLVQADLSKEDHKDFKFSHGVPDHFEQGTLMLIETSGNLILMAIDNHSTEESLSSPAHIANRFVTH